MSTNQTSFQDRLKKIEKKQDSPQQQMQIPEGAVMAGAPSMPEFGQGPKRESPIGSGSLMMVGGAVALLAIGAVFLRDVMAPPDDMTAAVMGGGERQVSLLGRLVGGSFDPQSVQAQMPIYHLPEARDGWIRATRTDVRKAYALDKLREQWPAPSGSTHVTLDENPGFRALSKFVKTSQVKTKKTEEQAKTHAFAHYLSSNGSHLQVVLRFLPADIRLGPENASTVWAQSMYAKRIGYEKGAAPAMSDFGGRPIVARGNPNLDPTDTMPQRVDLAVPLTANVYIKVTGNAAPSDVEKLLSDINVPGLLAFAG